MTNVDHAALSEAEIEEGQVATYESRYYIGLIVVAALWLVPAAYFGFSGYTVEMDQTYNVGLVILLCGLLYFAAGVRIVGPDNYAGVLVLGKPTIVVSGGIVIVLPLLYTLIMFTRGTIQMELPAEPENIFRDEDVQLVPFGKKPPIRITFANPPKDDESVDRTDPLEQRTTNEVSVFVRWKIKDKARFWVFYVRIQSLDEAKRQLEDMSVSMLQEELSQMTPSKAFATLADTNNALDNLIRNRTVNWGIDLIDARIKLIGLSHGLNSSIDNIAKSKANKQSTVIEAEGKKEQLTLEGQGKANAVKSEIDARTDGMMRMAKELGITGADVLGAETARSIGNSPSSKVVIGTDGFKQLVGVGAAIADSVKSSTPQPPTAPQP